MHLIPTGTDSGHDSERRLTSLSRQAIPPDAVKTTGKEHFAGHGDISRCPVFSFYEGQGCKRSLSVFCAIPAFRLYWFLVNDQERTGETSRLAL